MDRSIIYIILFTNLVVATRYYIKRNCEIPFFIAFFNIMVEYRLFAIQNGYVDWVKIDYGIFFVYNVDQGKIVSDLIVLGSSTLMYSFLYFYKPVGRHLNDTNENLKKYIQLKRNIIIFGLILFTFFQITLSGNISLGYGFLARLGNSSFIILLFLIAIFTDIKRYSVKYLYIFLFLVLGWITYSVILRFQFLGWMIPLGYFFFRNITPSKKIIYFFFGLFLVMIVFSSAGVLRNSYIKDMSLSEFYNRSVDRLMVAEDINFIDGFIMIYQIYPNKLDYTYGFEHLAILVRPIPRTVWPDKPLAGWIQNYKEKYKTNTPNVGFAPTIYGVFYAELGVAGIILFSIAWGKFLSYLYASFNAFKSKLRAILIGVLLASLVPIFRSGDLAGDFSIVLMSYWPLIIFVNQYNKFLRKQRVSVNV